MFYPGLFFSFMLAIFCIEQPDISRFLVIIAFGAAVITDTFAYFCGRLFGKHKLIPKISPKKTVEGAIGGLVFGTGAVVLLGTLLQGGFHVSMNPLWYALLGLILSALTQIGDLAASLVKRRLGIKDYGHIMGEHGGMMDRLDSVLFISPAVYAFYFILVA
jgi:phosphatidate cytidylyltransferase